MSLIGVVFGGPSPEHDISILTGLQAARALHDAGEEVCCLYWGKSGSWQRVPLTVEPQAFLELAIPEATDLDLAVPSGFSERRRLRSVPLDLSVVLNCCHGGPGEDGSLSGVLALCGVKVTGPRPQACALTMDKFATTALAETAGIPVIETVLAHAELESSATVMSNPPWVAKPRFGGSSIGVEANVSDIETVRALGKTGVGRAGMLIQPFLEGWTDLNVSVRTFPEVQVSAIERPIRDSSLIYGYRDKYLVGGRGMDAAPRELPAVLPDSVVDEIQRYTRTIVHLFALTGAPRVDFLWDGDETVVLCEINAIPGAWGNHLWQACGINRLVLYRDLISEALDSRAAPLQWVGSSDGQALRASGSISSKLS